MRYEADTGVRGDGSSMDRKIVMMAMISPRREYGFEAAGLPDLCALTNGVTAFVVTAQ